MVEVMGVEMDGNLRGWARDQRRVGSILVFGASLLVLVGGLVAWFVFQASSPLLYFSLLGVVVVVLALQVLLHVLTPPAEHDSPYAPSYAQPAPASGASPASSTSRTLTLRCGDCGTVFDLTDTGDRPLYHACPGCGAEGVLRDAPPTPAPEAPAHEYAPPPMPDAPSAAAPAAPVKRLKLRCGGCKEVFSIEDTGERPLRRPCPYCARMGEVR